MRVAGGEGVSRGSWGDQVLVDQRYLVDLFDQLPLGRKSRDICAAYPDWMNDVDPASFRRTLRRRTSIRWHVPAVALAAAIRRAAYRAPGASATMRPWYTADFRSRAAHPPRGRPSEVGPRLPVAPSQPPGSPRSIHAESCRSHGTAWPRRRSGLRRPRAVPRSGPDRLRDVGSRGSRYRGRVVEGLHGDAMAGILPERITGSTRQGRRNGILDRRHRRRASRRSSELFSVRSVSGSMGIIDPEVIASRGRSFEETHQAWPMTSGKGPASRGSWPWRLG